MKLEQLLEGVSYTLVQGSLELDIEDIIYDSRKAAPGRLFVCIVGTQRDSHDYAAQCVADGVTALVVQHDIDLSTVPGAAVLKVESSRYALALMSGNLFGNPSRRMTMIGVTGTKGKTTTTHMIKSVLEAAGRKVGMIGTNGIYFLGHHQETANTTPESYELQKTFREFLDAGCDTALMEVSSQGLMMDRVAGIHYDIGVFTNLSPDHIGPGEHKTFEEYRSWKGQLFKRCTTGVVNIDDENTEALLEGHTCKLVTYGCSEKADYRAGTYQLLRTHDFLGVQFHVSGKDDMDVKVNMPGEFSVYNALAALTVGKVLGLPDEAIHEGLGRCVVKGRVELVPISRKFTILLDYAHNEVSTESLLTTLRAYAPHRLVVVFGCGWTKVKLYFMLGLPTETEEDMKEIAHLCEKVARKYYEIPKDQRNGKCQITASSSFFVPKPFTPFQWAPMCTAEEYTRRAHLVNDEFKAQLNRKSLKYNWHDANVTVLEGIMARGDRRIGKVIEEAYRLGCLFDSWTESFRDDLWEKAFLNTGIEKEFYTLRTRDKNELFPWDFIDTGVSRKFLRKEWERAMNAEVTPNCREHCSGCGASKFGGGVCYEGKN